MNYKEYTLVLPTLNEEGSIGELLGLVKTNYPGMKVIVADDGSTDMTEKISKQFRGVKFINRKKSSKQKGLTASLIDGIKSSKTKYVICMDADLQHPPEKIADMALALSSGSKLVIGYRKTIRDWSVNRKIVSISLMTVGNFVLLAKGKQRCRDIFSGYFAADRRFFMSVYSKNSDTFVYSGYKIVFDLLKNLPRGRVHIAEVPYVFSGRKSGASKAGPSQVVDLLKSFTS